MPREVSAAAPRILIHIGFPKTASSWLQRNVFRMATSGFEQVCRQAELNAMVVEPRSSAFDPAGVRRFLDVAAESARSRGKIPVITNERFAGTPDSGGYDAREIAGRLHASFPDARILVVIREQRDVMLSSYKEYLRTGGGLTLNAYLRPSVADLLAVPMFRADYFEYDLLIAHYRDLFGVSAVSVIPYEILRNDPEAFLRALERGVGASASPTTDTRPRRVSFSMASLLLRRRLAPFIRSDHNPGSPLTLNVKEGVQFRALHAVDRLVPAGIRLRLEARVVAAIARAVGGGYAESNLRTQVLSGWDLSSLGYEVATDRADARAIHPDDGHVAVRIDESRA